MTCPVSTDVRRAAQILRDGGLVAFATETVYGLGADAFNVHAVARIFEVKGRPKFDPLIVHIADRLRHESLVTQVPPSAQRLAERFWPGPLTLVLPKAEAVPDLVTAGLSTVAVRIPDHPQALEFLRLANVPVAAPSANPFGQVSPTCAEHVAEQLGDRIDFILDGGPCRVGVESTVLQLTDGIPLLLRHGGVPVEEIEAVIGPVTIATSAEHPALQAPAAPGMLSRHYAPRTPLEIVEEASLAAEREAGSEPERRRIGLLAFDPVPSITAGRFAAVEVLSETGDLTEATANFFAALRRLDAQHLDLIAALPFPDRGLGRALNDRLRRAAAL
jgi:L-threonylcarbamoyladenylate synthase